MRHYRKNLSGKATFKSFVPTPLSEIQVTHTEKLDKLIQEVESAMRHLNDYSSQLSVEQTKRLMRQEAENSCKLALGKQPLSFGFITDADNSLEEDTVNLLKATTYAIDAMAELPLSARLLKNAHYLMCNSRRYEKKYPGEFRVSPIWIGKKGSNLNDALFVPPVYEDMTSAFCDLEKYINYEETENVYIRTALIHYQFEMIHPFIDANGRVGRLLNTLFLSEQHVLEKPILQLSHVLHMYGPRYYMELQRLNKTGNYEQWEFFFLNCLKKAALNHLEGTFASGDFTILC